jgi:O-glycosyl hydrolase
MKTYRVTCFKGWVLALVCLTTAIPLCAQENISIKFNRNHQTIDSFGASDAWTIDPLINNWLAQGQDDNIEALANTLFSTDSGIGLSGWRFNIGAGSAEQGSSSQINLAKFVFYKKLMKETFKTLSLSQIVHLNGQRRMG